MQRPHPDHEWRVVPPMFIAAIPVDAVTEMIRWARTAHRIISLIRTDFPVPCVSLFSEIKDKRSLYLGSPAGPVKKTLSPRLTLVKTSSCSGESCIGGGSTGSSTMLICEGAGVELGGWVRVGVGSPAGWDCEGSCCELGPIRRVSQELIAGVREGSQDIPGSGLCSHC